MSVSVDPRMRSAWRTWLSALAVDAEAALAAALAYESLAAEGRDAWLDALGEDAVGIGVPAVALFAPLLAVEEDEARRGRMTRALGASRATTEGSGSIALSGDAQPGERLCAILSPLYLDFVEVLVCRYRLDRGFLSARRDPIRNVIDVIGRSLSGPVLNLAKESGARLTCVVDGVLVTNVPLRDAVEDLAHAVLADRRGGRAAPEVLGDYAHLFVPDAPFCLDGSCDGFDLDPRSNRLSQGRSPALAVSVSEP